MGRPGAAAVQDGDRLRTMDSRVYEVLNTDQIEDLRGVDGGGMLARLVGMYLSKAPQRILTLRAHLAAMNLEGIAHEAHALKGASGNIGAARVASTCQLIEKAGIARDAVQLDTLLQALEGEFGQARDALQAMSKPGNSAAGR